MSKTLTKDIRRTIHSRSVRNFNIFDMCVWLKEDNPSSHYDEQDVIKGLRYLAVDTGELVRRGTRGNWIFSPSITLNDGQEYLVPKVIKPPTTDPITRLRSAISIASNANTELGEAIAGAEIMMDSCQKITDALSNVS